MIYLRNIRSALLSLLLMCGVTFTSYAQPVDTVWLWVSTVDAEPNEVYLTQLEQRAAEMNIALEQTTTPDDIPAEAPYIRLMFTTNPDGSELIIMRLHRGILELPSPHLYFEFRTPQFTIRDETAAADKQYALDFMTLALLYSLGRCDTVSDQTTNTTFKGDDEQIARFFVGNCALAEGDYEAAAAAFVPILDDASYPVSVVFNLAWTYLQLGREDDAFTITTRAVDAIDTDSQLFIPVLLTERLRTRAQIYALAFEFDMAIQDMTRAIAIGEQQGLRNDDLARLYKQRGDHIFLIYEWDRVLADYNTAIRLDPTYADAYFARGVLYYTQGPRPAAAANFEQFIALAPQDPRVPEAQAYIESIDAELNALNGDDTGTFSPSD